MKNTISILFFVLGILSFAAAQQQPHNTQFMYYKLGYNPGFAGSQETPCITCIYRQQWLGLEGAPSLAVATFNMPLANQRVGIGANLSRHTIGITSMFSFDGAYAYRVRLGNGMLGLGLQGSVRSLSMDFQKTTATQPKEEDASIPGGTSSKFLFNVGAGAYYSSERFYFGLSVPRLLENNMDFAENDVLISREAQHGYLMGGVTIPVSETFKLQPQALIKYVTHAPLDMDVNLNAIIEDRYVVGFTYRLGGNKESGTGESVDILVAAQLSNNIMFGLSYDYTLSEVQNYANGTLEASFHYCIGKASADKDFVNPRFF